MSRFRSLLAVLAVFCVFLKADAGQNPPAGPFHMSYAELTAAIVYAKAMLRDADIGTSEVGGRNAVLTVWNPERGKSDLRLVYVRGGVSMTPGYAVKVVPWNGLASAGVDPYNGVNTRYAVTTPGNHYVLAIKTNTGSQQGALYVPYNPVYQTVPIVRGGDHYIQDNIRSAQRRIIANDVRSTIDPSKLVTEVIDSVATRDDALDGDARILLTLIADEHIDKDEYVARGPGWTTDKVFVTLALNREETYKFAVSSAGAGGLAQFMSSTFISVHTIYPKAQILPPYADMLIKRMTDLRRAVETATSEVRKARTTATKKTKTNELSALTADLSVTKNELDTLVVVAMRDHTTAITAQFCLVDRMLKFLVDKGEKIPRDRILLGTYLAASYNAGEHRGVPWYKEHLRMCYSKRRKCRFSHGLPDETQTYTKKFGLIYGYLFGS